MRFFNTAGPVSAQKHYCLSPFERFDLDTIMALIQQEKYFILHAPRQTGKTSALLAFMDYLNSSDEYRCVYINVEVGQAAREDVAAAMQAVRGELSIWARTVLNDTFADEIWDAALARSGAYGVFGDVLSHWAEQSAKPLILLIDEIDSLVGDTLIALLRQLRAGYSRRPAAFPQSVVLCGVRDIRDYRIHSSREKSIITGGSAFNVKAESLRLGDFSQSEVARLYQQHTEETGQVFTAEALAKAWQLTQGQPWLVNALAYETCFRMKQYRDRSQPITLAAIEAAKERLILRRETHMDQLADKLQEERVRRVIEPLLSSGDEPENIPVDDIDYARDLGLIGHAKPLQIANPIYREIIPRQLTYSTVETLSQQTAWYIDHDGRLDMGELLRAFQQFFREHSEHWVERFQYKEAGPQLLIQAFLQRIVNSGSSIEREYGLGRMRTDLFILWPYRGGQQRIVLELKILRRGLEQTLHTGLEQTWQYMDRCNADEGHLVIFDRSLDRSWDDKLFQRLERIRDSDISVWGM